MQLEWAKNVLEVWKSFSTCLSLLFWFRCRFQFLVFYYFVPFHGCVRFGTSILTHTTSERYRMLFYIKCTICTYTLWYVHYYIHQQCLSMFIFVKRKNGRNFCTNGTAKKASTHVFYGSIYCFPLHCTQIFASTSVANALSISVSVSHWVHIAWIKAKCLPVSTLVCTFSCWTSSFFRLLSLLLLLFAR